MYTVVMPRRMLLIPCVHKLDVMHPVTGTEHVAWPWHVALTRKGQQHTCILMQHLSIMQVVASGMFATLAETAPDVLPAMSVLRMAEHAVGGDDVAPAAVAVVDLARVATAMNCAQALGRLVELAQLDQTRVLELGIRALQFYGAPACLDSASALRLQGQNRPFQRIAATHCSTTSAPTHATDPIADAVVWARRCRVSCTCVCVRLPASALPCLLQPHGSLAGCIGRLTLLPVQICSCPHLARCFREQPV
jgi:hypothetical protein